MMESEDLTGSLVSDRDIDDAMSAVKTGMIHVMKLPPELAVNLPNVLRCLQQLKTNRAAMKLLSGG